MKSRKLKVNYRTKVDLLAREIVSSPTGSNSYDSPIADKLQGKHAEDVQYKDEVAIRKMIAVARRRLRKSYKK